MIKINNIVMECKQGAYVIFTKNTNKSMINEYDYMTIRRAERKKNGS